MSAIAFAPARRTNVPLLLGFSGGTGSGKTYSALEVATGIAGDKPFAFIDTESGRGLHYADQFRFDHAEIRAPFRPDTYLDAVVAAENAGYPVVVIDSMSHVWAGEGGVIDWQEEELDRMAGNDWRKREGCKMAAWIKPKLAHKRMVQRLLQMRIHVIMCFRAEPKVEMTKDERGKTVIAAKQSLTGLHGWIPICEKMLPYELTASFLLMADKPGVVQPIKLQEQHRACVPLDRPIGRDAGQRLAAWARGGASAPGDGKATGRGVASQGTDAEPIDVDLAADIGATKAGQGTAALKAWWSTLSRELQAALKARLDSEWKPAAEAADECNQSNKQEAA